MAGGRKSNAGSNQFVERNDNDVYNAVRLRTQKTLRSLMNLILLQVNDHDTMSTMLTYKEELDNKWSEFIHAFENHEAGLSAVGSRDLEKITSDYVFNHNEYLKAKMRIRELLSTITNVSTSSANNNANNIPLNVNGHSAFKLPPIRITPFSGNFCDWIEFKATCNTVLIDSIPDIQRLQYLKDALFGEARNLVSHILPGDNSYQQAMQLLSTRYENTRAIVNEHLRKLYTIPCIETPAAHTLREMLNTVNGVVAALNCCNIEVSKWDAILIFHLSQRFDKSTLALWENKLEGDRSIPKLQILLNFIETRVTVLDTTETFPSKSIVRNHKPNFDNKRLHFDNKRPIDKPKTFFTLKSDYKCILCGKNHLPSRCDELVRMQVRDRQALITKHNLCVNCFYPHNVQQCPFESACKKCNETHHGLLHAVDKKTFVNLTTDKSEYDDGDDNSGEFMNNENDDALSQISVEHFFHLSENVSENVDDDTLLATAMVPVRFSGRSILSKSLIDQGATANVITIRICQLLNLKIERLNVPMVGVGNTPVGVVIGKVMFEIGSIHDSNYKLLVKAIVVKYIGEIKGFDKSHIHNWPHLKGLPLADPKYYQTHKIDLLLGGSAHADFILDGLVKGARHQPIAQNSRLGWFISGNTNVSKQSNFIGRNITLEQLENSNDNLRQQLTAFWKIEEVEPMCTLTPEEQLAEQLFCSSLKRADDGKFIIDLPFKLNPYEKLGESLHIAKQFYRSLENRFRKNPQLKKQYDEVLEEYLTMGHMELVTDQPKFQCFLPHHHVLKETSTTTKIRTVFNASAKTSSGLSLNDCLCVGPVVQPELFELLISWRKYEFAMSSDIEKMYRMMYVNKEHSDLQTILWHRPGTNGVMAYRLLTVTFGTSSAPFQATRGIKEIGLNIKEADAKLGETILTSFYVDDFLKSFSTIETACETREALTKTFADYGFKLRKWKSNDARILENVNEIDKEACIDFAFKTLGIVWQAQSDEFVFKTLEIKDIQQWTKRNVLSAIAKLFDPLGWLAPCIVKAKVLMQDIWRLPSNSGWDSQVPDHIEKQWTPIFNELTTPIPIKVSRWLKLSHKRENVELHAFCDASSLAYACCIYVRVMHEDGTVSCNLLTAKTKVAPIRATTIPRLELCGALLLSKLVTRCVQALSLTDIQIIAWCDSKIVLAWLATHPSKWVTFVANRVSEIQERVPTNCWSHISTKKNPADIASRGSSLHDLRDSLMWWHGPSFLTSSSEAHPNQDFKLPIETAPEKKKSKQVFNVVLKNQNETLNRFSDYNRLLRFTCYAFRWLAIVRTKVKKTTPIDALEMDFAEQIWLKKIQLENFGHEIACIKKNRPLPHNSKVIKLNPFIDNVGLLRMNGRVIDGENTNQQTSLILPSESHFVSLLIQQTHQQQVLHGGVQITLRALRERFWILNARTQVKVIIGHCMVCYRTKKRLLTQQMAPLPSFRTQQAKPFTFVGCDYAGFFNLKTSDRRNAPTTKGYIALFICLTTKALHLELAGDLTSSEFIMALSNFTSSRGIPSVIYLDNATNFVGGEREIRELHDQFLSQTNEFTRTLAHKRIQFKHIPARASHMAGIWERAVGLVKYHLKRVMGDTKLTARRFHHVLKQIECCLNSRPLWAITSNEDDIEVITPSHFFNFQPLNTLPRPDISHVPMNRLDQYQYLYRLYTDFWKGWSKEYLDQLQKREKWNGVKPNVSVGQIVVVSDDNLPPSKWAIGKIINTFPAKDGLVRVVEVLCNGMKLKRPIHRLGLLPILDNLISSEREQLNRGENVVDPSL